MRPVRIVPGNARLIAALSVVRIVSTPYIIRFFILDQRRFGQREVYARRIFGWLVAESCIFGHLSMMEVAGQGEIRGTKEEQGQ